MLWLLGMKEPDSSLVPWHVLPHSYIWLSESLKLVSPPWLHTIRLLVSSKVREAQLVT